MAKSEAAKPIQGMAGLEEPKPAIPTDENGDKVAVRRGLDQVHHGRPVDQELLDVYDFLQQRTFRYEPRDAERQVIERIKELVELNVGDLFAEANEILEDLYKSVEVTEVIDYESGETRVVLDGNGSPKRDWSQLSVAQMERTTWSLQRVIVALDQEASEAYLKAQFAFNVWDDSYNEQYKAPVGGTIQDRTASARRKTKEERYYYMWTYWYWKTVHDRIDSLRETRRMLEFRNQRQSKTAVPRYD